MPNPFVIILTLLNQLFFSHPNINVPTPTVDPIVQKVSQMTLDEKIRQILICGYRGQKVEVAISVLKSCGNLLYSRSNLENLSNRQIRENNRLIHQNDSLSWIMIDQEGGLVARIRDGSPSPRKMAEDGSVAFWGDKHGSTLKDLDFNVDLAPVADITENNPAIKSRSFADDPTINGQAVSTYLRALQNHDVYAVLKHLPGHGRVDSDTHKKTGALDYSWNEIKNFDLLPFVDAINNGAKIVMIGHIIIPEVDTKPASISPKIISELRSALPKGNELIFITDSLSMNGVGLPQDEAAIQAIKSGEDMVLLQDINEVKVFNKIVSAYTDGTLDKTKLDQSVIRILKNKISNTK